MPDPASVKVPIGYGADFQRSTTLGGSYATIGAIQDIATPGGQSTAEVKQTGLNDAAALFRHQFRAGIITLRETTVKIFFTAANYGVMFGDAQARTQLYYKFVCSDKANGVFVNTASVLNFSGFVKDLEIENPMEEGVVCTVKFFPDGSTWTFTSGT